MNMDDFEMPEEEVSEDEEKPKLAEENTKAQAQTEKVATEDVNMNHEEQSIKA